MGLGMMSNSMVPPIDPVKKTQGSNIGKDKPKDRSFEAFLAEAMQQNSTNDEVVVNPEVVETVSECVTTVASSLKKDDKHDDTPTNDDDREPRLNYDVASLLASASIASKKEAEDENDFRRKRAASAYEK